MGFIKEPKGVDLVIGPTALTVEERNRISEIIANYKLTGNLPTKTQKAGASRKNMTGNKSSPSQPAH